MMSRNDSRRRQRLFSEMNGELEQQRLLSEINDELERQEFGRRRTNPIIVEDSDTESVHTAVASPDTGIDNMDTQCAQRSEEFRQERERLEIARRDFQEEYERMQYERQRHDAYILDYERTLRGMELFRNLLLRDNAHNIMPDVEPYVRPANSTLEP